MILLTLIACVTGEAPPGAEAVDRVWSEDDRRVLGQLRLSGELRPDPTNRYADDATAARLGAALFFDEGLSGPGTVSCATCHDPALHFTDAKVLSVGLAATTRHAPAIPGSQLGPWYFWDGRADSLWSQAAGPIEDPKEMGGDRLAAVRHAIDAHPELWTAAFGQLPDLSGLPEHAGPVPGAAGDAWRQLDAAEQERVTGAYVLLLKAIGAYERTLLPQPAPVDAYIDAVQAGRATDGLLEPAAERGLALFVGRANCVSCHLGPMLTDRAFHNLGLPESRVGYDQGRTVGAMKVAASEFRCDSRWSDAEDCPELVYLDPTFDDFISAFKTPSLRDVARTAPYMHNGQFATLREVLDFYNRLPGRPAAGHRELTLRPLGLDASELDDLEAFLHALSGGPLPEAVVRPTAAR